MFMLIAVAYGLLLLIVLVQLLRLLGSSMILQKSFFRLEPTTQHFILVFVTLGRFLGTLWFAEAFDLPLVVAALVSSLPYLLMFWVFSLLIFQWNFLVSRPMTTARTAFQTLRPLFWITNISAAGTIVVLLGFFVEDPDSSLAPIRIPRTPLSHALLQASFGLPRWIALLAQDFAVWGSVGMGGLTLLLGLAFLWYGGKVAAMISETQSQVSGSYRTTAGIKRGKRWSRSVPAFFHPASQS